MEKNKSAIRALRTLYEIVKEILKKYKIHEGVDLTWWVFT